VPRHGWIFGCDECQSCCPFNQYAPLHRDARFDPLYNPLDVDWLAMDDEEFTRVVGNTAMTRSGLERIKRNVLKSRCEVL
jgi:epoxyqueuosine reductase